MDYYFVPHSHSCVKGFKVCKYYRFIDNKSICDLTKNQIDIEDIHKNRVPCTQTTIGEFSKPLKIGG